jgi:hypothetical protein
MGENSTDEKNMEAKKMEEMSTMFMAMLKVMKAQEAKEKQEKEQASRSSKCLHSILSTKGRFDGKNVTKYLKDYWTEAEIQRMNEVTSVQEFSTLVEPELRSLVTNIAKSTIDNCTNSHPWESFSQKLKEEFQLEDADRVTQATFLDWISQRSKRLGPQELLREFNKRFAQLSPREAEVIGLQRSNLFLRAADEKLQNELENALDMIDPSWSEALVKWDLIEKSVLRVTQRRRRRELDREATVGTPTPLTKPIVNNNLEGKSNKEEKDERSGSASPKQIDELSKLMENLKILTTRVMGGGNYSGGESSKKNWPCMWCDSKDHDKRNCQDLTEALKKQWVKYSGEPGKRKIAYYDSGEAVPLNNGNGGMKALVEKHMTEGEVQMAAAAFEPWVFSLESTNNQHKMDEVAKKKFAAELRGQTRWDVPVLITPITAEVGAAWDVKIEDKRKAAQEEMLTRRKQSRMEEESRPTKPKQVHFSQDDETEADSGPSPMKGDGPASNENKAKEKTVKKGPGWILGRDVERELDIDALAEKFWKQEVKGFTNEELFGSMRREFQEAILTRSKKKRFYKEGPHALTSEFEEASDVYHAQLSHEDLPSDSYTKVAEVYDTSYEDIHDALGWRPQPEDVKEPFWARSCSECEVELEGIKKPIKALIDSGSEVNLMSKEVFKEGQWMVDRDIRWGVKSVNATKNDLWGACPGVKVKLGHVVEPINIFVHDNLPYPLILGQPFITELRMETIVLDNGTHVAKVKSKDGLRVIQFPTVRPGHERNRKELRYKEDEGKDF